MRYNDIISEVEKLFSELDAHLQASSAESGLSCPQYCGRCCMKPYIEASVLEFIPLAAWLYRTGQVDEFMEKLDNPQHPWCACFDPEASSREEWGCQYYGQRGLICRLFGFGYRLNRDEKPVLVTCRIMKTTRPGAVAKAASMAEAKPGEMPVFSNYFMRLLSIDPDLAVPQLPINEAIRRAIEKLYYYFAESEGEEVI